MEAGHQINIKINREHLFYFHGLLMITVVTWNIIVKMYNG